MFFDNQMRSRAGKFTTSKHMILKKQDEILTGTERKFIVQTQRSAATKLVKPKFIYRVKRKKS